MSTLTAKARKARQLHVEKMHRNYRDYNQKESASDKKMADAGHPNGKLYTACRAFFDTLKYACNSRARLVAMSMDPNGEPSSLLEFWCPTLSLPWSPFREINGTYYGHLYPAHASWNNYIDDMIADGFRGVRDELNGGQFLVTFCGKTPAHLELESNLHSALLELKISHPVFGVSRDTSSSRVVLTVNFHDGMNIKVFKLIKGLLKSHFKGLILPLRTAEDDEKDGIELPLAQRSIAFGGGDSVMDNGRVIHIPLSPLGSAGDTVRLETAEALIKKVEEGLPFATAEPFLAQLLNKKSLKTVTKRFCS